MKVFLEIAISASPQQQELLIPTMIELGCQGFQQTDFDLLCYLDRTRWTDETLQSFQRGMKGVLDTITVNAHVRFREIVDQDWNQQWERSIQPIEVSSRIVVKPSWQPYTDTGGADRIVIEIDPKMAFGTGHHETTRLVLRLLERHIPSATPARLLDVGTGSGILAIAAVKLGAGFAVGVDNDAWAIANATENVEANHVTAQVEISNRTLSTFPAADVDCIAANLTLNTNIEMLGEFHRILKPGGIVLLSGLLTDDRNTMCVRLVEKEFKVLEVLAENEWIAIAAVRA